MTAVLAPGLERRLKAEIAGEVLFSSFDRGRYATDASHYQVMPVGVVVPHSIEDVTRAMALARQERISVLARGGGTSQAGQTVNTSLVLDCSRKLNRIIDLDVAGRRCLVEPGIVLDELNRRLKPHGLWFPVDISTASRATIGGMVGNNSCGARSLRYGNTRENIISIDALLADGTAAHFGPVANDLSDAPEALRPLAHDLLGDRRARGGRSCGTVSQGAAPGRRLQSRCADPDAQRSQPRAYSGRLRGYARVLDSDRAQAVAVARPPRSSARATSAAFMRLWMRPSTSSNSTRLRSNWSIKP